MEQSIQQKESLIVGTILACNKEIGNFCNQTNLFEDVVTKNNIYHFNMLNLYSNITDVKLQNLNESEIFENSVYIKMNSRNNYLTYFKQVDKFLSGFDLNLQKSLNESLIIDKNKHEDSINLDINTFKKDLKTIINELLKINDLDIPTDILKIKMFANKPLFVYGFNIMNNMVIQTELFKKYNLSYDNILAIVFNKYNNSILFCIENKYYSYSIEQDLFSSTVLKTPIKNHFYLKNLKTELGINVLYELYMSPNLLNIKFTDNLYNDVKISQLNNSNLQNKNNIAK